MLGSGSTLGDAATMLSEQGVSGEIIWMVVGGFVTKGVGWLWGMHRRSTDREVKQAVSDTKLDNLQKTVEKHDRKIEELSTDRARPEIEDSTDRDNTKSIKEKLKTSVQKGSQKQKNRKS